MKRQRREVHYSGRVQGVGFRYTTRSIAQEFKVTGFVQNLTDGRVRLVVEGAPDELAEFLRAIKERLGRYVTSVQHQDGPAAGEYNDFSIRFGPDSFD